MSTVKDILIRTDIDKILNELYNRWDSQKKCDEGYRIVIEKLMAMTQAESDCVVHVDLENDEQEGEWIHVYGTKPDSDETWALDLMPWPEWLGSEVGSELSDETVAAGVLYEMTYFGFSEDRIDAMREKLEKTADELIDCGDSDEERFV